MGILGRIDEWFIRQDAEYSYREITTGLRHYTRTRNESNMEHILKERRAELAKRNRAYYLAHRDEIAANSRAIKLKNLSKQTLKQKHAAWAKTHYEKNREQILAKQRERYYAGRGRPVPNTTTTDLPISTIEDIKPPAEFQAETEQPKLDAPILSSLSKEKKEANENVV